MTRLTRRHLLAAGAAALAAGPRRVGAAEYRYRLATLLPSAHPANVRLRLATTMIGHESDGAIDLAINPAGRLGDADALLAQLAHGAIEFVALPAGYLAETVPEAGIATVGFAFRDYDEVWAAMDGAVGARVRMALGRAGYVAFACMWDTGFRQIASTTRPIATVADLAGLAIRIEESPASAAMFRALGAVPRLSRPDQLAMDLQLHVVEGQEVPLSLIELDRVWQAETHLAMTAHRWDGLWLLANVKIWAGLPTALREIMVRRMNDAAVDLRDDLARYAKAAELSLGQRGMVVTRPDPAAFRAALRTSGYYGQCRREFGPDLWADLEATVGGLE